MCTYTIRHSSLIQCSVADMSISANPDCCYNLKASENMPELAEVAGYTPLLLYPPLSLLSL